MADYCEGGERDCGCRPDICECCHKKALAAAHARGVRETVRWFQEHANLPFGACSDALAALLPAQQPERTGERECGTCGGLHPTERCNHRNTDAAPPRPAADVCILCKGTKTIPNETRGSEPCPRCRLAADLGERPESAASVRKRHGFPDLSPAEQAANLLENEDERQG